MSSRYDVCDAEDAMGKLLGELIEDCFSVFNSEMYGLSSYTSFYKKLAKVGEMAKEHLKHVDRGNDTENDV